MWPKFGHIPYTISILTFRLQSQPKRLWPKFRFWTNISIVEQNFDFWPKIPLLAKIFICLAKVWFLTKISILYPNIRILIRDFLEFFWIDDYTWTQKKPGNTLTLVKILAKVMSWRRIVVSFCLVWIKMADRNSLMETIVIFSWALINLMLTCNPFSCSILSFSCSLLFSILFP